MASPQASPIYDEDSEEEENEESEEEGEEDSSDEEEEQVVVATPVGNRRHSPRSRRRPTQKAAIRVDYSSISSEEEEDDDDETEEEEEEAAFPKRKPTARPLSPNPSTRQFPRRRKKRRATLPSGTRSNKEEEEAGSDSSGGSSYISETDEEVGTTSNETEESEDDNKKKKDKPIAARKQQQRGSSTRPVTAKAKVVRTCPHCNKVFSSLYNHKYHVDHYVCRKDDMPEEMRLELEKNTPKKQPPETKAPKKQQQQDNTEESDSSSSSQATVEAIKVDGSSSSSEESEDDSAQPPAPGPRVVTEAERTCPYCDKVFSNLYGHKYHVENYVCRKDEMPEELKQVKEKAATPTKLPPRRRKPRRQEEEADSSATETEQEEEGGREEEETEEEDEWEEEQRAKKRQKKEPKKKVGKPTCPHCQHTFAMRAGLDYHLEHQVCQREKAPAKKPPFKRPPASRASGAKFKKFRGKKEDRTCPKCNRVFTSIYGRDYHVKNRVCEQITHSTVLPFGLLEPGAEFVTNLGVVRVVQDSRAFPTATLPKNADKKFRLWKAAKGRLDTKRKGQYTKVAVHSLARRKRLSKIVEQNNNHNAKPTQIWKAYFGSTNLTNPGEGGGHLNFPMVSPESPEGPHPLEPDGSHPDRIVECIRIPDRRKVIECMVVKDPESDTEEFVQVEKELPELTACVPMKFYMERRQLTQIYNEEGSRYHCGDCGKMFYSVMGCKHHVTSNACQRNRRTGDKVETPAADSKVDIDERADILIEAQDRLVSEEKSDNLRRSPWASGRRPSLKRLEDGERRIRREKEIEAAEAANPGQTAKRKWKAKKKRPLAYYPQVWQSLGFKVVPKAPRAAPVSFFKKKKSKHVHPEAHFFERDDGGAGDIHDTMKSLKEQLIALQSEQLGAFYPEVWKVLRFRKPREEESSESEDEEEESEEEEEEDIDPIGKKRPKSPPPFVPKPPAFGYAAPPVILDISVLAGEIDMGRYPSMNRITRSAEGDTHSDACYMCKDSRGLLYLCDFCSNVNHLECLRTRFIIKDPEPSDDFMCNKCIQNVLQRRRRAEKRRKRIGPYNNKATDERATKKTKRAGPAEDVLEPKKTEPENEFDALAEQGKHVGEILDLLRDSQARLQQLVETSRINDFRRSLFGE